MSVLGVKEIKKLIAEKKLVEDLGQRDLEDPEGAGLDLRVGEIFEISGETYLGVEKRKTVGSKTVAKFNKDKSSTFTIRPDEFYLFQTEEKVTLPENIVATLHPRSTLLRSGVWVLTTQVAPGYSGTLNVGIKNMGPASFTIELGARFLHIIFHEVTGKGAMYRGQWQGGRVTTTEEETQV